jgi:hypothetical protein
MYMERESSPYCVQFATDDLKWMSRTQLEDAYRLELIDQSTMVYQEGYPSWRPLRETTALGRRTAASSYHVEVVPGEVKKLTLEQIGDALRTQIIDGSTQVYCPVTHQWRSLEDTVEGVMSPAEPDEQFHVAVAPGDVRCLTLEQLDELYRQDVIDESVMIWRDGSGTWQTLGDVIRGSDPAPAEPEDPPQEFYVQLEPGEVKCLSLEQLDDLYRLDVIGNSTMVWQPGFASWHSLEEVAGLTSTTDHPHPAPRGSLASLSLAALPEPPKVSPWFGRCLLLVAGIASIVTAYRNDVFYGLAESIDQRSEFVHLEAETLGAPGIDTPRGLQGYLDSVAARYGLDDLSHTKPVPPPEEQQPTGTTPNEAAASTPEVDSEGAATTRPPSAEPKSSTAKRSAAAEKGPRAKQQSRAPKRSRTRSRPPKKNEPPRDFSTIGQIGGDPYDPLNGKL